ncbi:MAG: oligoendopeptidase F [Porticoccaceae bacterium]|jgi:oligoendopeptidase F|nr:oligoendopeptidase F [Porticoccaceae bacterium]MBT5577772.1 oligoendopeptidase F [Porticoccaceae bacterium]MBT7375457.1 oligoendopeptidase F [Porticoccaceae bacterium]
MSKLLQHAKLISGFFVCAVLISCSEPQNSSQAEGSANGAAQQIVDEKYIWDLTDLYPDNQAWDRARLDAAKKAQVLAALKGTLGDSSASFLYAADTISEVYKEVVRVYIYASLLADEDTGNADNAERRQLAVNLYSDIGASVSWYSPELLSLGEAKIREFIAAEPEFEKHVFGIENSLRQAPHTLGEEVETVLAKSSKFLGTSGTVYSVLANANLPWPEVTLSSGEVLRLSQSGYSVGRQASVREDRKAVFNAFWGVWKDFEATLGALMNSHVQGLVFRTQVRNYESSLGRALYDDNMPEAVYQTLVAEVNTALPTLHRYFKLRKRMLNIKDDMRYYDIYPPLVDLDKTFSIEDSIALTRRALAPLGDEYMAGYDAGVEGRWMHVYPSEGKRSGAYMSGGAYDVHPYVLLNHNDDYDSASTFAHEYGHAVHSVLANKTQTWENAGYSTFIAETASIMNEMLLQDMVVSEAQTDQEKLFYLGSGLESLRGTFFRQTMFAEFELKMNEEVEAGNVLTGAKLSKIYLELLKRYHGHDLGVVTIDDLYAMEWAFIPHFYRDFYVFQYATSITAAAGLAERISSQDVQAQQDFIELLKAGGSDYPYQLMKNAGIDMATPAPYRALVTRMNTIMDEMEAILDRQ